MKIFPVLLSISALLAWPAHADDMPSVFFTPTEMQTIDNTADLPPSLADIHLGAVLYYRPDNWTVWIDGERWTPETHRTDLQILEVRPGQVKLQLADDPQQPITLRPHQTYRTATKQVIEGN